MSVIPPKPHWGRHNKTIFRTYGAWFVGMIIDHGFSATKIEPLRGFIDYGMTLFIDHGLKSVAKDPPCFHGEKTLKSFTN